MENQSQQPVQQPNPVNPPAPPVGAPRPQPDAAQIANDVAAMAGNYVSSMNTGLLPVVESIKQAITIGVKNAASLIVASILYVLTIWIPYLNVGTTIAMLSIPIELSKGNVISPTFIFKSVYRKYMGQFFLLSALMTIGILMGIAFVILPAVVLSYSWCIAIYLLFDKKVNAIQALIKSNEFTYGYKMKIFCIKFLFGIVFMLAYLLIMGVATALDNDFGAILAVILTLVIVVVQLAATMGLDAVIYRELLKRKDVTI